MGAIIAHRGWCKLFTENEPPYPNDQQAATAYAALWLNGLLPGRGGASETTAATNVVTCAQTSADV
jgi:hypothetical protein